MNYDTLISNLYNQYNNLYYKKARNCAKCCAMGHGVLSYFLQHQFHFAEGSCEYCHGHAYDEAFNILTTPQPDE